MHCFGTIFFTLFLVQKKFLKIQVTLEDLNPWKNVTSGRFVWYHFSKLNILPKSLPDHVSCPLLISLCLLFNRYQLSVRTCFCPNKMLGLLLKNYASFAVERILRYQTSLLWQFREFSSLQTDHPKTKIETKRKQKWITIISLQRKGSLIAWG